MLKQTLTSWLPQWSDPFRLEVEQFSIFVSNSKGFVSANVRLLAKMQLEEYTLKTGQILNAHIASEQNLLIHTHC